MLPTAPVAMLGRTAIVSRRQCLPISADSPSFYQYSWHERDGVGSSISVAGASAISRQLEKDYYLCRALTRTPGRRPGAGRFPMVHEYRADRSADAASEVIGHILLVAVVVILGAVIASFAFGMAANVTRTVAIAVSATQNGDDIVLTYEGGRDVPMLYRSTSPPRRRTARRSAARSRTRRRPSATS